jgi:uncharacterized membrane protein
MKPESHLPWSVRLGATSRLLLVLAAGVIIYVAAPVSLPRATRALVTWDAAALGYLVLAWMTVVRADAEMTKFRARLYDQSGFVIFILVLTAACASVVAIGFVVGDIKQLAFWQKAAHLSLSITALVLAWLLIHTLFAFHYAREYYGTGEDGQTPLGGLSFPGGSPPDYFDFAYYALVVGMTSQVSDVAVTSRHMRRETLIHGVLSFVFNVAVFAMSVNIISGAL